MALTASEAMSRPSLVLILLVKCTRVTIACTVLRLGFSAWLYVLSIAQAPPEVFSRRKVFVSSSRFL